MIDHNRLSLATIPYQLSPVNNRPIFVSFRFF
jgi:hypothetical protein